MLEVDIHERVFRRQDGTALTAVRALSFELEEGSLTCMTGPSGCGKTTTLRMILGLDTCYTGRIAWRDGTASDHGKRRVAAVFQEPRLLPWRSVEENVRLALHNKRQMAGLDALFDALGLASVRDFYPAELSLGMARRVALARAFAVEPGLLLLDEPFVSLDEPTAERLRRLLLELWQSRPTTTLMVTHNIGEAVALADRILVLSAAPARLLGSVGIDERRADRDDATRARLIQRVNRVAASAAQ